MMDSFFCKLFSAFLLPLSRIWAARAHGATVPALTSWTSWDATNDEHDAPDDDARREVTVVAVVADAVVAVDMRSSRATN